jgi:hypothetical protein
MKKLSACLMFVGLLALSACGGGGMGGSSGNGGGGAGGGKMDNTEATVNMYLDGTMQASYWIQVHADPQVGQYWETSMDAHGTLMTNRWQVSAIDGDHAIIEHLNEMDSDFMESSYVIAYRVDLTAGDYEPNVLQAWIGIKGEAGEEISIMDVPEATGNGEGVAPDEESFSDVEIAGKAWSGTKYTTEHATWWQADDAWFNGQIKMDASGMVTELTAFGDDAEPLLNWE